MGTHLCLLRTTVRQQVYTEGGDTTCVADYRVPLVINVRFVRNWKLLRPYLSSLDKRAVQLGNLVEMSILRWPSASASMNAKHINTLLTTTFSRLCHVLVLIDKKTVQLRYHYVI